MTTITCTQATVTAVLNDSAITAVIGEELVNSAVDTLNIYLHTELARLTGTPLSMSASWTSQQLGAVKQACRVVYASFYKNASNRSSGISALTLSPTDLMSNSTVQHMLEKIANRLNVSVDLPPIYIGQAAINTGE